MGYQANVSAGNLTNATAIGANAVVDASNKIRLGDDNVSVIEAQVGLTVVSDKTKKENFHPVDGEEVLSCMQAHVCSWLSFSVMAFSLALVSSLRSPAGAGRVRRPGSRPYRVVVCS